MKKIKPEKILNIKRFLLLLLCFLSASYLTRILLILGRGKGFQIHDTAGFASDLAIGLIVTLIFLFIAKYNRYVALIIPLLWCAFHYSNYEHVLANGDIVSLSYAKYLCNPTFLCGSAFAVSNWILTISILLISLSAFFIKPARISPLILVLSLATALAGISTKSVFASVLNPRWRCYNVVHANMEDIIYSKFKKIDLSVDPTTMDEYASLLKKDMNGTPFVSTMKKKHNVLLVVLEGCCGGMLPSIRDRYGICSEISMPMVDSISMENIAYTNFITLQRQTNRGMFSILAGCYPKLNSSTPKMTEYVTKKNLNDECTQEYLPQLLSKQGYETTYLQASPLPYMLKDIFMKQAGFDYCYGTKWHKYSYASNYWGVDDKAFFEQAFELIASKKYMRKPWFMTLLTVGTHHPLNIPEDYGNLFEETKRQRAYRYLDEAISEFIKKIHEAGFLRNTLVILTCDESQGVKDLKGDPPGKRLCQQWGLLSVLHPRIKNKVIERKYTQLDIAISVVDYLGLPFENLSFGGRSIFRDYDEDRDIYFANTYNHVVGRFTKDNKLEVCDENFNYGEQYEINGKGLFSLKREFTRRLSPEEVCDIARFGYVSNGSVVDLNDTNRNFDFHSGITHVIIPGRQKTLLGGQFFTIPKNSAVSVTLKGRITSTDTCIIYLKHDLAAKSGKVRIVKYMPKELKEGDSFSITYDFYTPEEFYSSEFRVTAQLKKGEKAKVILDEASLSYSVRPPTPLERKAFFKRFNKNIGRDLGAFIMVENQDSTTNTNEI